MKSASLALLVLCLGSCSLANRGGSSPEPAAAIKLPWNEVVEVGEGDLLKLDVVGIVRYFRVTSIREGEVILRNTSSNKKEVVGPIAAIGFRLVSQSLKPGEGRGAKIIYLIMFQY